MTKSLFAWRVFYVKKVTIFIRAEGRLTAYETKNAEDGRPKASILCVELQ